MSDASQLEIPASFVALFVRPGQTRPHTAREVVAARYELCEDLAQSLAPTASHMQLARELHAAEVLAQCQQAICGPEAVINEAEAQWVVCRLAELLDWEMPAAPAPSATH
jgi:hypothetical protein